MSGNRDVDAGAAVGEGCVPVDGASLPEPQAVASMSEAASAIHPRIPQKDTEDSPTVVFVAAAGSTPPKGYKAGWGLSR
jgi:hypothetical protein